MVAAEPPEDAKEPMTHLRVRLPTGETLSRRFLASSPLSQLLLFLESRGYPAQRYRLLAAWPLRDVSPPRCRTKGSLFAGGIVRSFTVVPWGGVSFQGNKPSTYGTMRNVN